MPDNLPALLNPETKRPAPERFKNAEEVREVCRALRSADNIRSGNRTRIQGVIDGNRPYPPSILINNGQGWRANVNYREAEGLVQAQRTPYYDLVTEVSPCVQLSVDYGSGQKAADWAQIIAEEAHRLFFGWKSYDWHVQLRQSEKLTHGWGTHLWLNKYDWRMSTKTMRHVLFPDGTTSDLEDLEYFVVRDPIKAHRLWKSIADKKYARSIGWKVDAVINAIIEAEWVKDKNRKKTPEDIQQMMKNGDMGFGYARAAEMTLNHIFVKELDKADKAGGISHYIVAEDETTNDYLFVHRNRFACWEEILAFFPYDIGSDGTIHSIRGLGARIFPFCELFNRLKNNMADNVLVNSGILLTQQGNGVDMQRLQLTNIGPLRVLPAGVMPAQWRPIDLSNGPLALSQELKGTMMENTKTYRQYTDDGTSKERTAFEVSVNQGDQARLEKSAHNLEYRGLDAQYQEMLRRACNPNLTEMHPGGKAALDFQARCKKRGVPAQALQNLIDVRAARAIGAGSAAQRIIVTQQLLNVLYPIAGPVEKNRIMRDWVSALINTNAADRYVPEISSASVPTDDDAIAVLENNALISGQGALVAPGQNHARHAARHLVQAQQMISDQIQPAELLQAWNALGPHIAEHLSYLSQDPTAKREFETLKAKYLQLARMADKLQQHVEEQIQSEETMQAALQPANGSNGNGSESPTGDPELDMAYQKMMGDFQLKMTKLMGDMALKKKKLEHSMDLADTKTAASIRTQAKKSRPYKRGGDEGSGQ